YGKLAGMPADQVKELLNVLADAGLVERHGIEGGRPGAFVLALTAEGRRVARGEYRPELPFPLPAARRVATGRAGKRERNTAPLASAPAAEADPALLEQLKTWRREEARRRTVPPYVIFHDSTLEALAASRPHNREALRQVRGVGPAKLEAFGA